ncbi:Protein of unknown function [Pyronema omphalodes CBS 100304]|uniref:Uncharacterized protein n=1 Tax=Pyronema omphalodes (strain CBS 100304) TaxID=1076935 RepID=U4LPL6_PYROM|nr:Protein of unknown function [Pyronema omphalodes CBS 100304]
MREIEQKSESHPVYSFLRLIAAYRLPIIRGRDDR